MTVHVEPSAGMLAAAFAAREMFNALVQAGFTEPQAIALVAGLITNTNGGHQ